MELKNDYYTWNKGEREQVGKHFSTAEFSCQCSYAQCVEQKVAFELVARLDACRDEYGAPIFIDSGFRCMRHQMDLVKGGKVETVPNSTHELGHAADVKAAQMTKFVPILKAHFRAIGMAKTWAHVDLRDDKIRRWFYR